MLFKTCFELTATLCYSKPVLRGVEVLKLYNIFSPFVWTLWATTRNFDHGRIWEEIQPVLAAHPLQKSSFSLLSYIQLIKQSY